jgi:DNA-binding GntR family transcriptional regulator
MATRRPRFSPERLPRKSSGEEAALYVHRLIFEGRLRPGERVPQDEIAQALGISRIPLREAIIALEREGWVTLEMNRGAFVNALDEDAVRDHYELFGLIYGFTVQRALSKSGQEFVQELAVIERQLRDVDDPVEAGALMFTFFAAVVEAAKSPRIKVVLRSMSSIVPGDFFVEVPNAVELERRSLAAIMRALKRGDGEKAAREWDRMMRDLGTEVVDLLTRRGLFSTDAPALVERARVAGSATT